MLLKRKIRTKLKSRLDNPKQLKCKDFQNDRLEETNSQHIKQKVSYFEGSKMDNNSIQKKYNNQETSNKKVINFLSLLSNPENKENNALEYKSIQEQIQKKELEKDKFEDKHNPTNIKSNTNESEESKNQSVLTIENDENSNLKSNEEKHNPGTQINPSEDDQQSSIKSNELELNNNQFKELNDLIFSKFSNFYKKDLKMCDSNLSIDYKNNDKRFVQL
jgi:hypothetical protein